MCQQNSLRGSMFPRNPQFAFRTLWSCMNQQPAHQQPLWNVRIEIVSLRRRNARRPAKTIRAMLISKKTLARPGVEATALRFIFLCKILFTKITAATALSMKIGTFFFVFPPALADFGIWYLFIRQTKGAFSLLPATNFHKRNPREEKKRLKFSRYFVRSFSEENTMLWAKSYPGREVVENFFSENCRRFTVGREFSWWHKSFNLNANMARDLTATWGKVGGFGRKRKTFKT